MIIRFFYNSSKSLFAKILFGAIIFSFGLWGVGDIVRSYVSSRTAIQVGKHKIPVDRLRYQYSQAKQNLRNKEGKPLTPEELKRTNVKEIILDSIIAQAVEAETIRQLDIVVPKISLAQIIHSLPEFQTNGKFDERLYANMLQQSGMSEAGLLNQIRDSISRNQLFHPIISGYKMPDFIREALGSVYETQKTIWMAKIDITKTRIKEQIDDDILKQYYQNNADKYKKPELRNIAIMKIDYTKFVDEIKITEQDVKSYLSEHMDMFKSVETRDFERFEFDSQETADATWDKLNKGETKIQKNAQSLHKMKKSDFPKYISDNIFNLSLGKFSQVYSVGGKFYIYKLTNINTPKEKSNTEMLNEARKALQADKLNSPEFYSTIRDIKNKIEDAFAGGADLDAVTKDIKADIIDLPNYDKNKDSEKLKNIIKDEDSRKEIQEAITTLKEKQASPIIDAKEDDTVSYVVWNKSVTKEKLPPFDDVKDTVLKDYELEAKNKETLNTLNDLCFNANAPMEQLKKFNGVTHFTLCKKDMLMKSDNKDLEKIQKYCPYPGIISEALSVLHQGQCKYYRVSDDTYILVGLDNVKKPKAPSSIMKFVIKQFMGRAMSSDIYSIAQNEIKNRQKITLHEKVLDDATKTVDNQE